MRIYRCFCSCLVVPVAAVMLCAAQALATVSTTLTQADATPTSTNAAPGTTFTFTASLVTTSEQITGADYYLTASDPGGWFTINDRNTAGSPFSDPLFFSDAIVEASPSHILNPRNDHDLGGLTATTLNAGTHLLANYTIGVSALTPPGTYTIMTAVSAANEGWIDPMSGEHPFDSHGSFTVFVPEPGSAGMIGLALVAFMRRRRLAL